MALKLKKSIKLYFASLLFVLQLFSCGKTERTVEYYENGSIKAEIPRNREGRVHGLVTTYFPSGKVYSKAFFDQGLLQGERLFYYESGELRTFENFSKGKLNGYKYGFSKKGDTLAIFHFINGQKEYAYALSSGKDTLAVEKNGKTFWFFHSKKIEAIFCNADTANVGVIEFDSITGNIARYEGELHCLTKKDSVLLTRDYPNWQIMLQEAKKTALAPN